MGCVFKRKGSKYWQATYKDVSGRQRYASTGTTSKRDAQAHLAGLVAEQEKLKRQKLDESDELLDLLQQAVAEARKGRLSPARVRLYIHKVSVITNGSAAGPIVLRDWVKTWLKGREARIGDSTMARYEQNLHGMLKQFGPLADRDIASLTPEHIEKAMTELRRQGLRASTINYKLGDLRSCLEEARNRGLIERNAAKLVHKLPEEDSIIRAPFTRDEIAKLIAESDPEWGGFIRVAAYTGLRLGDVRDIKVKDYDPTTRLLSVRMKKRKRGSTPKIVQVPLAAPVRQWFSDFVSTKFPGDQVFARLSGIPTSTLSTQFSRLMEKAGVSREIELPGGLMARRSFHCLRHTFVSWLAEGDVAPEIRKRLAGHTTDKVHEIYTHRSVDALAAAIDTLPDLTGSGEAA